MHLRSVSVGVGTWRRTYVPVASVCLHSVQFITAINKKVKLFTGFFLVLFCFVLNEKKTANS